MKNTFLFNLRIFSLLFFCLIATNTVALGIEEDSILYDSQIKKYRGILDDPYFRQTHRPNTLQNQYEINKSKFKQLRLSNQKMMRLYDEEKMMNQKLRKMLSRQIEEEFRLRAEFKKIQKEFEVNQKSFMANEMKTLGATINDYEGIKNKSNQLTDKMTANYEKYMEYQKEFKKQQEEFYQKQVEFYEKIESAFDHQMEKYEDLKAEISEVVK